MKKRIGHLFLLTVVLGLGACNNDQSTSTETQPNNAKDTVNISDSRRNTTGTTNYIYDTANKNASQGTKTGGTPRNP